jgi:hypothetical protein
VDVARIGGVVSIVAGGGYSQQGGGTIMGIAALSVAPVASAGLVLFRRDRKDT